MFNQNHSQAVQNGPTSHPPTQADISPTRPESAKTDSLPRDTPFRRQGRSERPTKVFPSLLGYMFPRIARMSPPLRAFNEGSHRAIHLCWRALSTDC
jgi:hypothetical protein